MDYETFSIWFTDMRNFGTIKFSNSQKEFQKKLKSLEGEPPSLIDKIDGCTFAPRCPDRETKCNPEQHMSLIEVSPEHFVDICSIGKDN